MLSSKIYSKQYTLTDQTLYSFYIFSFSISFKFKFYILQLLLFFFFFFLLSSFLFYFFHNTKDGRKKKKQLDTFRIRNGDRSMASCTRTRRKTERNFRSKKNHQTFERGTFRMGVWREQRRTIRTSDFLFCFKKPIGSQN